MDLKRLPDRRRRTLIAGGSAGVALTLASLPVHAQEWPSKPIRLLIGYAAGGGADATARMFTPQLGQLLGQPVVVENKAGASGTLATAEASHAAPDGYTLTLVDNAPLTIVPVIRAAGYDPLTGFTPISMVVENANVLVTTADFGANNARQLIEMMRKAPGRLNYASGGAGSLSHLAAELFKAQSKTFAVHVPYRGAAPAITDLIAGQVQFAFLSLPAVSGFIAAKRLKALGVTTASRHPALPNVPTIAEQGLPGYEVVAWLAMMGPPGMPPQTVAALKKALADTLAMPAVIARLEGLGHTVASGKVNVRQRIADELAMWRKLISEQKIVFDI